MYESKEAPEVAAAVTFPFTTNNQQSVVVRVAHDGEGWCFILDAQVDGVLVGLTQEDRERALEEGRRQLVVVDYSLPSLSCAFAPDTGADFWV